MSLRTLGRKIKNKACIYLDQMRWWHLASTMTLPKKVSAMIRVRNGEEYLYPAIISIYKIVDEIVIVDNRSSDATSAIINRLSEELGNVLVSHKYDFDVVRVGEETVELFAADPTSPRLTHNFYNWCLSKCRHSFILKWDDDMIASKKCEQVIKAFKNSRKIILSFGGENISQNFDGVLSWKAGIEPRIFPKTFKFIYADYSNVVAGQPGQFGGQSLERIPSRRFVETIPTALYAHLKYCKKEPASNQSRIFASLIESEISTAGKIPEELVTALTQFGVVPSM